MSQSPPGVPVSTTVGNKSHDDNVVVDDDDDDDDDDADDDDEGCDDDNVSETYADVLIDTNGHNDCQLCVFVCVGGGRGGSSQTTPGKALIVI